MKIVRRVMSRPIADNFFQDRQLFNYLILLVVSAVLGVVELFMGAENGVINGYSLLIALFLPTFEIFFVYKMRKMQDARSIRQWAGYYFVFFGILTMMTMMSIIALGVMIFAPEEGQPPVSATEILLVVGLIISCLYYCLMGISGRQIGNMQENKPIRHCVFLVTAVMIQLVNLDTLSQMMQNLMALESFSYAVLVGIVNGLVTLTMRTLLSMLLIKAHRQWNELNAF